MTHVLRSDMVFEEILLLNCSGIGTPGDGTLVWPSVKERGYVCISIHWAKLTGWANNGSLHAVRPRKECFCTRASRQGRLPEMLWSIYFIAQSIEANYILTFCCLHNPFRRVAFLVVFSLTHCLEILATGSTCPLRLSFLPRFAAAAAAVRLTMTGCTKQMESDMP